MIQWESSPQEWKNSMLIRQMSCHESWLDQYL